MSGYKSGMKGADVLALLKNGLPIVDDVSKLDPNAELGSAASVITPGTIEETSFRNLYQADASILDPNTYTLNTENCSLVGSLSITPPSAPIESSSNVLLAFSTANMSLMSPIAGDIMVQLQFAPNADNTKLIGLGGMMMDIATQSQTNYILFLINDDGSVTVNQDQIDALNDVFANNELYYLGTFTYMLEGAPVPSDFYDVVDTSIKAVASNPSKAHVYLKKDNWEELYAKDFEKLRVGVNSNTLEIASLASSIPTKVSQLENDAGYTSQSPYEEVANREDVTPLNGSRYFFTRPFYNKVFILDNLAIGDSFIAVGFCSKYKLTLDFCFSSNKSVKRSIVLDSDIGLTKLEITLLATNSDAPEVYVSSTKLPLRSFIIEGAFNEFTYDQTYGSCVYLNGKRLVPGDVVSSDESMNPLVILNDEEDFTTLVNKFAEVMPSKKIYAYVDDTYIGANTSELKIIEIFASSRLSTIAKKGLLYSCNGFSIHSLKQWCNLAVETDYNRKNVFNDTSFLYVGEDRVNTDLIIPGNITKINLAAFSGLSFNSITFEGDVPKLEKSYYCNAPEVRNHISVRDLKDVNHLNLLLPESYNPDIKISGATIKYYTINYPQAPILRSTTINEVHITKDCYKIPSSAFKNCKDLNKVSFDNSVEFGSQVFADCSSLKEITIPANCTFDAIQSALFSGSGLRKAVVLDGNSLRYLFWFCEELEEVQLSDSLTIIGSFAFSSCKKLHTINIPENCHKIEHEAFSQCKSLTNLFFPKAVLEIGVDSFFDCTGMKVYDFSTHKEIPVLEYRVFVGDPNGYHIVVPDNLYDEWIAATNWSIYASHIIKKSDWDASQTTE